MPPLQRLELSSEEEKGQNPLFHGLRILSHKDGDSVSPHTECAVITFRESSSLGLSQIPLVPRPIQLKTIGFFVFYRASA